MGILWELYLILTYDNTSSLISYIFVFQIWIESGMGKERLK